jgi:hypothetical protein
MASAKKVEQEACFKQLRDLALLSHGMLKGEELNTFIERNIELV